MFKLRSALILLAVLAFYPAPLSATLISFEDLAEGTIVSDQYSNLGVIFTGMPQVLTIPNYAYGDFPPHSGSSVIAGLVNDSVTVTFAQSVQNVSIYGSIGRSGFIGDMPRYLTMTATAFDDMGAIVAIATITGATPRNGLMSLQGPRSVRLPSVRGPIPSLWTI